MRFFAFCSLALLAFSSIAVAKEKPNIVFFLIDDLGWADLGCYGSEYHLTPEIDALAARGMRFTNAYAACPVCSPTRASILTGKYPARLGITDWIGAGQQKREVVTPKNAEELPLGEVTLAEALKEGGYATGYLGKWHLGGDDAHQPDKQGFDFVFGVNRAGQPGSYFFPYSRGKKSAASVPDFDDGKEGDYLTEELTGVAERFIGEHKDGPFLLYFSHYAVHTPIEAKKSDIAVYTARRDKLGISAESEMREEGEGTSRLTQNNPAYAGMVDSVDKSVGRIVKALESAGIAGNTIIIFTSDNGGLSTLGGKRSMGPTSCVPLRAGKGWVYEGGIRVPFLVDWPGVTKAGSVSEVPVTSTDIYPTLLGMAGLDARPDQHRDGRTLVPVLEGADTLDREALFWHYPHYHGSGSRPSAAVRAGDYKLVRWYESGAEELYNLDDDPAETRDRSADSPEKRQQLSRMLDEWIVDTGAKLPEKP